MQEASGTRQCVWCAIEVTIEARKERALYKMCVLCGKVVPGVKNYKIYKKRNTDVV